ncbi:S1C family serine protease [Ligilactobacillus cholophilus]|uniref:S1C family serine protease n=1 Tax=Ligilactobacillus cholophilus TaxID=3050131 RepID=UPI0025B0D0A5|nr:trypsin-like peptidase domain-containing protein [Ligilactobacillus cholophilus]
MDNKNQYNGDYTQNKTEKQSQPPKEKKMSLVKVFIIALLGGVLGGGGILGGYAIYQHYNNDTVTQDNRKGKTVTSNIKVTETNQATKAFDKVKDAVVSVEAYSTNSNSIDDLFGNITGGDSSESATSESEGSGVIYKKDGNTAFIVTNNHVISGADKVEVLMNNGKKLSATVVGHDSISDLAVLKINAQYVTEVASFGNSNDIQVGQTALAIGSPMGSEYATSLTEGIISAKKRTIDVTNSQGVTTGQATVIQTDAAINPGNSGGPLINLAGQVIGINSMKLSNTGSSTSGSSTSVEGMGFAIPSNEVVSIINQLVTNGKVIRPALGISLVDLANVSEEQQKDVLKLPSSVTEGIVVAKVNSDSPLKNSGITKGDVIVELGGKKVTGIASLKEALYDHKVGDTVEIQYYHDGQLKKANVKLTLEANDSNTTSASNEGN